MKCIGIAIPLEVTRAFLKVDDKQTFSFKDKECTDPIPLSGRWTTIIADVPDELELIEVVEDCMMSPAEDIHIGWNMYEVNPKWKMPGLKKVNIIFDDYNHEVSVIDERPDSRELQEYLSSRGEGARLWYKKWALAVYTMESKTIGTLYVSSYITEGEE